MKLTGKVGLFILGAVLLPSVAFGVLAQRSLTALEAGASAEATAIALRAERHGIGERAEHRALTLGARLGALHADLDRLREDYEGGRYLDPAREWYPRDPSLGVPGYGTLDPKLGAWADWNVNSKVGFWMPRATVAHLREGGAKGNEARRALRRAAGLAPRLERIAARYPQLADLVWMVSRSGVNAVAPAYSYREVLLREPSLADYDENEADYVRAVAPDVNPSRASLWLPPYLDEFKNVRMTSIVAPLYLDEEFEGSVGIDVLVSQLAAELYQPAPVPVEQPRDVSGRKPEYPDVTILLGPSTEVVARAGALRFPQPVGEPGAGGASTPSAGGALAAPNDRLDASTDPGIRALLAAAKQESAAVLELTLYGEPYVVAVAPVPEVKWNLVTLVPLAHVQARSEGVERAIAKAGSAVLAQAAWVASVLALLPMLAIFMFRRQVLDPVLSLSERVDRVSPLNLELVRESPDRNDEIGQLERKVGELLSLIRATQDRELSEKARFEATLRSIADGVVAIDAGGRVALWNPQAAAMARVAEPGSPFDVAFPLELEDGASATAVLERALATSGALTLADRLQLRGPDGEVRSINVSVAPVRGPGGERSGAVAVLRDVTEARRLEDELVKAQKLESVQLLAAGIAHDFNNLLAGVLGFVSVARALLSPDHPATARLLKAEAAIDRGRGLTAQLVTFSRGGEPMRQPLNLAPLLVPAAELGLRGRGQLRTDVAADLWWVSADAGQLGQVFQNLVLNAAEAGGQESCVTLVARNLVGAPGSLPEGRYVEVAVVDNGMGIPPENLKRIFDPFFTTKKGGSGLGLAVCYSILRKHGGDIAAQATPGRGTTMRLWLPAVDPASVAPGAPPRAPGRVLLMDDDSTLREVTTDMLEGLGYCCVAVPEGESAIKAWTEATAAGQPFDVVLLDLTVPHGLGGRATLDRLRELQPDVLAVVCSGYASDPILATPAGFGFAGALKKPFDLTTLRRELERVRERRA